MRGWSSILAAFLLLAVAYWSFTVDGFGASTLMCAAAALFFLFQGAQGLSAGDVGDPLTVIEFVRNPAEAIVDTATDRLSDWLQDDEPKATAAAEQPRFDADAAIARYLAQRESQPAVAPVSLAPHRGFGRKGA